LPSCSSPDDVARIGTIAAGELSEPCYCARPRQALRRPTTFGKKGSAMAIRTRLTETFGINAPIFSAPMGLTAGGKLAAAVSGAGGLGFLGAGAGDPAWIDREFTAAGNARVGCGFITWAMTKQPQMLDLVL